MDFIGFAMAPSTLLARVERKRQGQYHRLRFQVLTAAEKVNADQTKGLENSEFRTATYV